MKARIITIGDEILIGQIIDSNSAWLAEQLYELDVSVEDILSVSDNLDAIRDALERALKCADLVLLTGGLGPTKDDITKKAIADFLGVQMKFDQDLYDRIKRIFVKFGRPITQAHKDQCYLPEGVIKLDNKMGTAPGMLFHKEEKSIVSLPGVPYEMKYIFNNSFQEAFGEKLVHDHTIYHKTIRTAGMGESRIAETIEDITAGLPEGLSIAFLPSLGSVRLRISGRGDSRHQVQKVVTRYTGMIEKRLGNLVYGYDNDDLEKVLKDVFDREEKTLATAESCTGGHVAHVITSVPGSSSYFKGAVVAYDNSVKENLLGVRRETLAQYGAVSKETVKEMLDGLLKTMQSDIGIAISGIAGPAGGSPEKPVGTIWLAWGSANDIRTTKLQLGKDRLINIKYTTVQALNRVRLFLTD